MHVLLDNNRRCFFTSDHHFGHANIIKYTNRPYYNVNDMDFALIDCWNEFVAPDDLVFHLGDFTLGDGALAKQYFSKLNGDIAVLGYPNHHDARWLPVFPNFDFGLFSKSGNAVNILDPLVSLEFPALSLDGQYPQTIVLCHFPLEVWDRKHYGAWHLYGHIHDAESDVPSREFRLNVGVDLWNGYPVGLDVLLKEFRGA